MTDWPLDDPTFASTVCEQLTAGLPLTRILEALGESTERFWSLHARDVEFRDRVFLARSMGVERLADEILEIAEERSDPRHRNVRIEVRKWLLSKLLPRRYGERVDVNVTQTKPVEECTDEELHARLAAIAARRAGEPGGDRAPAALEGAPDGTRIH